ncbi:hypothetical protein B0H11DRAFT_2012422 [Mycena galericulata]|nr:hypothetical protein B0H11DRAFT_2012422 [Mycena galericulata]
MHPTVKAETYENPSADDAYAAAALALEQAQRALSTMRVKPPVATIPVAEAAKQLNELRETIAAMQGAAQRDGHEIDELQRVAGEVRKERDDVRSELERKLGEIADMKEAHERERQTIVAMRASLTEDREALQAEQETLAENRERLNAQRVAVEAENQVLLDNRNIIAENLQRMGQLVQRDPLPPAPEAVAPILPDSDRVSNGLASVPSRRRSTSVSTSIPSRNGPATQMSPTPIAPEAPPGPSSRTSPHSRIQGSNRGQPLAPCSKTSSPRSIKTKVLRLLIEAKSKKRVLTKQEVDHANRLLLGLDEDAELSSDQSDDSESDDEHHSDYSNQDEIDQLVGKHFSKGDLSGLVKHAARYKLKSRDFVFVQITVGAAVPTDEELEAEEKCRAAAAEARRAARPPLPPAGIHRTRAKIYSL